MSRSRDTRTLTAVPDFGSVVHYYGYGRFSWPSTETPGKNWSVRVNENRKTVSCNCDEEPGRSAGDPCSYGRNALRVIRDYIDPKGLWEKAFSFDPASLTIKQTTREKKRRSGKKWFEKVKRSPETEYDFPHGKKKRSLEQEGRRNWYTRVCELAEQLKCGTKSRLDRIEFRHRIQSAGNKKHKTIGGGAKGRSLGDRLCAVVFRALHNSYADEAERLADSRMATHLMGTTASEGSILNYFHDRAVRTGLLIWLAMTARAVHRIAQYVIADSTAFASSLVEVWVESDYGTKTIRFTSTWQKGHVLSDAATNIVGAIIPTANRGRSADVKMLKGLLRRAKAAGWNITAVLGDKGYFDKVVRDWCEEHEMILFVPLKDGLTEETKQAWDAHNGVRSKPSIFKRLMRFRPKIESVFSAWKRMFQPYAFCRLSKHYGKRWSGLSLSQEIELLAYAVAYNLRRLAILEKILKQRIDLARGIYFYPMPDEWVSPESKNPSLYTRPDLLDDEEAA